MGMLWNEDMERKYSDYRHSMEAWEVLHEEVGFEDIGLMMDRYMSDLDGSETHMHFYENVPHEE